MYLSKFNCDRQIHKTTVIKSTYQHYITYSLECCKNKIWKSRATISSGGSPPKKPSWCFLYRAVKSHVTSTGIINSFEDGYIAIPKKKKVKKSSVTLFLKTPINRLKDYTRPARWGVGTAWKVSERRSEIFENFQNVIGNRAAAYCCCSKTKMACFLSILSVFPNIVYHEYDR